ncbi:MAG: acyl-ACP--UDP-N-acetylglucosamine O-acyltransferase, partial [bacterium]
GPFSIIEKGTVIGEGTVIHSNVEIKEGTHIGRNCEIHHGAVLGGIPQDIKFRGEESYLRIGDGAQIREYVTLHRASGEGEHTIVGEECMLMANSHIGHNCRVGKQVVLANLTALGGFVTIGDYTFIGGLTGIHQFVKVGEYVMVGAAGAVFEDVPPFMMTSGGYRSPVCGLNIVGLRRAGFSPEIISELKKAYRLIYKSDNSKEKIIETLSTEFSGHETIRSLISFLKASERGISRSVSKPS